MCGCVVGVAVLLGREGSGGRGLVGTALPGQEGSGDGIDYNDKDGGRCHKRGGADDNDKEQKLSFDNARRQQWWQQWWWGCHAESIILSAPPAESMVVSALPTESILLSVHAESKILSAPSLKP